MEKGFAYYSIQCCYQSINQWLNFNERNVHGKALSQAQLFTRSNQFNYITISALFLLKAMELLVGSKKRERERDKKQKSFKLANIYIYYKFAIIKAVGCQKLGKVLVKFNKLAEKREKEEE